MLLHACRVAKEQGREGTTTGVEQRGKLHRWNNSTLTLVNAVEAQYRYRLPRYHVEEDQRWKPENPDCGCSASSPFILFPRILFFFLSLLVPLFPWPQPSFHDRSKNIGHWIQCNAMQISIYVISYRVRSLASRINEIWEVYAFSTISLDFFFNFYRLVEYLDWCKDEVKICEN